MFFFHRDILKLRERKNRSIIPGRMPFVDLLQSSRINELYPKSDETKSKNVSYGTAGFRTK